MKLWPAAGLWHQGDSRLDASQEDPIGARSSNHLQHHPTSSNYHLWKMATAAAPPVSTTPTQSTDGVVPVISASDSTSTTSSSLGAAFVCRCNSWESPIYLERNTQWECFIGDSFGIPLKNYLKKKSITMCSWWQKHSIVTIVVLSKRSRLSRLDSTSTISHIKQSDHGTP